MAEAPRHHHGLGLLSLGALGIVFGDIGTSPLYALQTVFAADQHAVRPTESGVYGVISLVFWAITLIVSIKYVALIMRADNEGEGGIMALIALIRGKGLKQRFAQVTLVALGIFGASLFYGDGMITPAISVLSAVEGIEVVEPSLHELVVPITLVILAGLFAIQRFGTGAVGRLFGPIMALWFTLLAVAGLHEVVKEPGILRAISPTYAVSFMFEHGHVAFIALGSVVLTVTGAEALYADMGHFGRRPIRLSWFSAVFPALILNYMGQGALILHSPKAIENPFYLLIPHWGRIPMIGLATVATVIASQAVISGAFSVTRQAVQLGFLPRLTIRHTSREAGQVYVPAVNWGIFVAVVLLVVGFGSSQHLAAAYGIAVTGTLAIDTVLFFVVVHILWGKPKRLAVGGAIAFLIVDLAFFSANLPKVVHGGWFPLAIAALVFLVLTTWQRGREIITKKRTELEGPLRDFVEEIRDPDSRSPAPRARASSSTPTRRPPRSRCAPTSSTTASCTTAW
jgi:KUP system potassium uptake protein